MFTFEYLLKVLSSIVKNDGDFSESDLRNWYYDNERALSHCSFPKENDLSVDRILKTEMWCEAYRTLSFYFDDLGCADLEALTKSLIRLFDMLKVDVLSRDYNDYEKSSILISLFNENQIDKLTDNEIVLYRNLALELAEKNVREGLIAVGYGSYGGDTVFQCNYALCEKCMLQLMETVDKMPEKGFYANTLGYIYYYGRVSGTPDYQKAYLYFSFGAACGVHESIYKLSDMYLNGYGGIKSRECARKLLMEIYPKLFSSFVNGDYECAFADVAFRLGKITIDDTCEGFPLYGSALNHLLEARYALSLRHKFGDENVKAKLEKSICNLKDKMNFEKESEMEIYSLDYVLWKNSGRDMVATVTKTSNKRYNLNVKMKKNEDGRQGKVFVCCYDLELCGLFDEINIPVSTYGDVQEGTYMFNDVSFKDLMLGDEVIYRLPGNCTFIVSCDIVK